jgi:hypothetical protein
MIWENANTHAQMVKHFCVDTWKKSGKFELKEIRKEKTGWTGSWLMGLVAYPNYQGEPYPGGEGNQTMGAQSGWSPLAMWRGENKPGSTRPWVLVWLEESDSVQLLSRGSGLLCVEPDSSSAWSSCLLCGSEGRVRRIIWQIESGQIEPSWGGNWFRPWVQSLSLELWQRTIEF